MIGRRKPIWIVVFSLVLFTFACVTINIYFPAEKVQSVAGEIVDEIRGQGEGIPPAGKGKTSLFRRTLLALAPAPAWAQDATTVSNPTIRALKAKMKGRFVQMKPYYQKGMLKEGNNGYVAMGDAGGLGLKDKRDLKGLVDAENNDREALYREVAKALNIDPSQISRVAEIFAKEWQNSL